MARGEDHNVVCVHLRQQNLEGFFCSPIAWPLPASLSAVRLAIACFKVLHFSAVRLATACFFLEILLSHCIAALCHIALL